MFDDHKIIAPTRRNLPRSPIQPDPYCDHGPFDACRCLAGDAELLRAAEKALAAQRDADGAHNR